MVFIRVTLLAPIQARAQDGFYVRQQRMVDCSSVIRDLRTPLRRGNVDGTPGSIATLGEGWFSPFLCNRFGRLRVG
jgi:hypothetical protein